MKRLISTIDLPKEDWLKIRKQGITGTDAGAIVGLNPYKSAFQVYIDKTTEETENYDNEAMRQGRDFEDYVAKRFEESTGFKVRRANAVFQNEEHPFMLADFDRLISGLPDGKRAGLECKTVSPYMADKWKDGNVPAHYMMQVQHYLAVSGYDEWWIAALIFGREYKIIKVERDEELIRHLITIEERFWNEHVLAGVMPDPDGSTACNDLISKMYFKSDKDKSILLSGCDSILKRRQEVEELIKKLEQEKSSIDQTIKLEMKDATIGMTDNFKVSWSDVEQNRLDSKRLKEEKPDIYKLYSKPSLSRRFTVNRVA